MINVQKVIQVDSVNSVIYLIPEIKGFITNQGNSNA
jgi:hypothetical protein